MADIDFTRDELVEISDAISATLGRYLSTGDPENHEKKYNTLSLLHQAQAQILPAVFGFSIDDTPWGPARARQINDLRVAKGLNPRPLRKEAVA